MNHSNGISLGANVLNATWPSEGPSLNLKQALESSGNETLLNNLSAAIRSLEATKKLSEHPILAVTGQLNSGKSSVVASFLSNAGRDRVPRGSSSATGTHRFVYWVPQVWLETPAYKALLLELIASAHPSGVEFLSQDPSQAAEQYRSGRDNLNTLSIPLIAGDPLLNELGIGLLDCPDIQTQDSEEQRISTAGSDNPRLDFLAAASRACSAFLLVWSRAAIRDRLLETMLSSLRKRMPSAPLYLLINMIRPEQGQPAATMQDHDVTRLLERFCIQDHHVYGAFDYAIEDRGEQLGWRHYTPASQVTQFSLQEAPQFYQLSEGTHSQSNLHTLSATLETAELQLTKIQDHLNEQNQLIAEAQKALQQWVQSQHQSITEKHEGLLQTCHDLITDDSTGEPLQIMSSEFAEALRCSLIRAAPLALKIPLKLANPFDKAFASTKKFIQSLHPKTLAKEKLGNLESELKKHLKVGSIKLASSESLARRMQALRWCPPEIPVSDLEKAWNQVFLSFQKNPIEKFNTALLDSSSKDYWSSFSLKEKFTVGGKALLGTLGGLAAVCGLATLAVDGGATLYAATSISHAIHSGIALAVTAGGSAAAVMSFKDTLLKDNTLPYLARLFSIACDCFGLPKTIPNHPSTITFKTEKGTKTAYTITPPEDLATFPTITPLTQSNLWSLHPLEESNKQS